MEVPFAETHNELAGALYRQKGVFEQQSIPGFHTLLSLEHRLRAHIHVLSRLPFHDSSPPDKDHELFVYLARQLSSPDPDASKTGLKAAIEYLGDQTEKSKIAIEALALYPPAKLDVLEALYAQRPELRMSILKLWGLLGVKIDSSLVNSALQQDQPELVVAAMSCLMMDKSIGIEFFRDQYNNLDRNHLGAAEGELVSPILWGWALRSRQGLSSAIMKVIERGLSFETSDRIFRLAALLGDRELQDVLEAWAINNVERGLEYLAFSGRKEVVPILLQSIESGKNLQKVGDAWYWITGFRLKFVSAMGLVSPEGNIVKRPDSSEGPVLLDMQTAQAWWQKHKSAWNSEERRILGQTMTNEFVASKTLEVAGRYGYYCRQLLAILTGSPALMKKLVWRQQLDSLLREQGLRV